MSGSQLQKHYTPTRTHHWLYTQEHFKYTTTQGQSTHNWTWPIKCFENSSFRDFNTSQPTIYSALWIETEWLISNDSHDSLSHKRWAIEWIIYTTWLNTLTCAGGYQRKCKTMKSTNFECTAMDTRLKCLKSIILFGVHVYDVFTSCIFINMFMEVINASQWLGMIMIKSEIF